MVVGSIYTWLWDHARKELHSASLIQLLPHGPNVAMIHHSIDEDRNETNVHHDQLEHVCPHHRLHASLEAAQCS